MIEQLTQWERCALSAARMGKLVMKGRAFYCGDRKFHPSTIGTLMGSGLLHSLDGRLAVTEAGEKRLAEPPVPYTKDYYQRVTKQKAINRNAA